MSKPGSYIDDGKGNLTPNMADEAMAARAGTVPDLRTKQSEVVESGLSQRTPESTPAESGSPAKDKKDGGKTK